MLSGIQALSISSFCYAQSVLMAARWLPLLQTLHIGTTVSNVKEEKSCFPDIVVCLVGVVVVVCIIVHSQIFQSSWGSRLYCDWAFSHPRANEWNGWSRTWILAQSCIRWQSSVHFTEITVNPQLQASTVFRPPNVAMSRVRCTWLLLYLRRGVC